MHAPELPSDVTRPPETLDVDKFRSRRDMRRAALRPVVAACAIAACVALPVVPEPRVLAHASNSSGGIDPAVRWWCETLPGHADEHLCMRRSLSLAIAQAEGAEKAALQERRERMLRAEGAHQDLARVVSLFCTRSEEAASSTELCSSSADGSMSRAEQTVQINAWWCALPGHNGSLACRRHELQERFQRAGALERQEVSRSLSALLSGAAPHELAAMHEDTRSMVLAFCAQSPAPSLPACSHGGMRRNRRNRRALYSPHGARGGKGGYKGPRGGGKGGQGGKAGKGAKGAKGGKAQSGKPPGGKTRRKGPASGGRQGGGPGRPGRGGGGGGGGGVSGGAAGTRRMGILRPSSVFKLLLCLLLFAGLCGWQLSGYWSGCNCHDGGRRGRVPSSATGSRLHRDHDRRQKQHKRPRIEPADTEGQEVVRSPSATGARCRAAPISQ